jgi:polyisoprenoid-binding protein YceI
MKNILALVAAGLLVAAPAFAKPQTLKLDPSKSQIKWTGTKVTGSHNGTVPLKSGNVLIEGKDIKGGKVEIDMTRIKNDDLTDKSYNDKLVNHLKSDDFFGVEKHPVSTFEITSVKPLEGGGEATHEITGKLTIKGHTEEVTFPAKVSVDGKKATATGKIKVDRTKFGVRYGSGKFFENLGDKMIHDEFELDLSLSSKM